MPLFRFVRPSRACRRSALAVWQCDVRPQRTAQSATRTVTASVVGFVYPWIPLPMTPADEGAAERGQD
jgi:hypothetical protein